MEKDMLLISCPIVYRQGSKKGFWFIVEQEDGDGWEIPKMVVRKGESSVRASIRMMGEMANMDAKVIEEAGRAGGMTSVNGKAVSKRTIYYAMIQRTGGEIIGFEQYKWLEYAKAVRKLSSKRERAMIKSARAEVDKWLKEMKGKVGPDLELLK
jgi:hypothetical protein